MAGAEPAAELALGIAGLLAQRHAAQMGTDADHHQPFRLLDTLRIGLRIAQLGDVDRLCFLDLFRRAVAHEDRLAAPEHCDRLADLDMADVDFGGGQRQRIGRRIHLIDERPGKRGNADGGYRTRGQEEEVPSRPLAMRTRAMPRARAGLKALRHLSLTPLVAPHARGPDQEIPCNAGPIRTDGPFPPCKALSGWARAPL